MRFLRTNRTPLHVADNPVGLESSVLEVMSLLGSGSEVSMVGIYGIGGIGKTTVARAAYNMIADQFEGLCFLADIREKAISKHRLVQLQETLLSHIYIYTWEERYKSGRCQWRNPDYKKEASTEEGSFDFLRC